MNPTVMTDAKRLGIDKTDAGALAGGPGFQVNGQRNDHLAAELGKPGITNQAGE